LSSLGRMRLSVEGVCVTTDVHTRHAMEPTMLMVSEKHIGTR
jgi:hypothetical protein